MNKRFSKIIVLVFAVFMLLLPANVARASTKSDAEKVLKYYSKGQISKAKKYNKKLPKKASKTCIKKLSKKTKAAYRKVVKKYKVDSSSSDYLWGYYLIDLDGDKKAELLVRHGSCEADVRTAVYKYKDGKAKKIDEMFSGHIYYCAYPGHAGVICVWGHMGYESVSTMTLQKGKLKIKKYGDRDVNKNLDWFPFRQVLDSHIKYDKNYNRSVDWKDLK